MVERYFKLKPFLDSADDDLAAYMPSPLEERQLRSTLDDLKDFESVSKKLQEEGNLTLADVRALFDSLMEKAPSLGSYLAPQAPIVKFPIFEMACVQVLNGETRLLTRNSVAALAQFAAPALIQPQHAAANKENKKLSFAEQALKKRKVDAQQQPR